MAATTNAGTTVERLMETGAHFAQARSRRHPTMKRFILGAKARVEIVDLQATEAQLDAAKKALEAYAREGKTVLFVGGKTEVASAVRDAARKAGQPYVAGRWLGGTLSNFAEIKKRIDRLRDLSEKRDTGAWEKQYTKLERVMLDREIKRLEERLEGIENLAKRPDALLIVDAKHEKHATKEANDLGIPVIAVMGSDNNLREAAFPIVANDASRETVAYLLGELSAAYQAGRAA
jgi:small subunit ribosomal protein S2